MSGDSRQKPGLFRRTTATTRNWHRSPEASDPLSKGTLSDSATAQSPPAGTAHYGRRRALDPGRERPLPSRPPGPSGVRPPARPAPRQTTGASAGWAAAVPLPSSTFQRRRARPGPAGSRTRAGGAALPASGRRERCGARAGAGRGAGQRVHVPCRESRPRGRRGDAAAPRASAKSYRRGPRLPAMRGRRPPWRRCPSRGREGRPGPALLPALLPAFFPAPRQSCRDVTRAWVTCRRRPPRSAPAGPAGREGSGRGWFPDGGTARGPGAPPAPRPPAHPPLSFAAAKQNQLQQQNYPKAGAARIPRVPPPQRTFSFQHSPRTSSLVRYRQTE